MGKLYAFIKCVGGAIMRLIFRQNIIGKENIPSDGGFILCCNHTHFMDVAFLVAAFKQQIYFMAKQELFGSPLAAKFLTAMGAFPVQRGAGASASNSVKTAEDIVNSGKVMGIFPEGTRSPDGSPKKAKSGVALIAASTKAKVVPVSIYYEGKLKLFKKVTVRIGKAIEPEDLAMVDSGRSEIRRVATLIMDRITEQWQAGHSV